MGCEKQQRVEMFREFGLIIFLFVLLRSEAVLRVVDNPSLFEVSLGRNITLPCILADSDRPQLHLDLKTASVRWDLRPLNGSVHNVYLLTDGNHTAYRPKSHIEASSFSRGIASLSMWNVREGDEGDYTCSVYVTPDKFTSKTSLQVSARPNVTLTSYELTIEPGHERSVLCQVNKFYPKSITIRWFKSRKGSNFATALDKDTCNSVPAENGDGTFNATSLIVIKPSSTDEDGDVYYCIVKHRSFNDDKALHLTLAVKEQPTGSWMRILLAIVLTILLLLVAVTCYVFFFCKKAPKITNITGAEYLLHKQKSNLNFSILDFKPKIVSVCVYLKRENDSERIPIYKSSRLHKNRNEGIDVQLLRTDQVGEVDNLKAELEPLKPKKSFIFYDWHCTLRITPNIETDDGAELTVQVEHPALKTPIFKQSTLIISGDCLRVSPADDSKILIHGEEVTLTCNIAKYSPGPLQIIWIKEDVMKQKEAQVLYEKGKLCDDRYTHTPDERQEGRVYTVSSSLAFTVNASKDHGKIYICQVNYHALGQEKQSTFNTYIRAVPEFTPITSKPAKPSAGQEMELSCNFLRFHPYNLTVEWYKESEKMLRTENTMRISEDGLYNVTSTVKHTFELEDLKKTFRCKVSHESLENPRTLEWTFPKENH